MSNPPTITAKNLPPSQQPSAIPPGRSSTPPAPPPSVEIQIPYDQIEAKPLREPSLINLHAKNPNIALRFGNRAVGEKESTLRYDQLIAMGFVPAKPDDVYMINPDTGAKLPCPGALSRDGRVIYGDLILLKIGRAEYVGALKWNEQSASRRVRRFGTVQSTPGGTDVKAEGGRGVDGSALSGIPQKVKTREGHTGIVQAYVPPVAESDARTADNSGIPASVNLAEK